MMNPSIRDFYVALLCKDNLIGHIVHTDEGSVTIEEIYPCDQTIALDVTKYNFYKTFEHVHTDSMADWGDNDGKVFARLDELEREGKL